MNSSPPPRVSRRQPAAALAGGFALAVRPVAARAEPADDRALVVMLACFEAQGVVREAP